MTDNYKGVLDQDKVLTSEDQMAWVVHVDQVERVPEADHFGFVSQPAAVVDILV